MYGAHMYLVFVTPSILYVCVYRYICIGHAQHVFCHCKMYSKGGRQLEVLTG